MLGHFGAAEIQASVPNGSPVRFATTSAWWTVANTVAIRTAPAATAISPTAPAKGIADRISQANRGHINLPQGVAAAFN